MTNQCVAKMPIFRDRRDMREFLTRFRNYPSPQRCVDSTGRPYPKLCDQVSLLGYCLMENHFHLILHQLAPNGMNELMRRAPVAYARYFNLRHDRCGPMFRSRYKAKPIESIEHAKFTVAYTHLNEVFEQLDYEFSSHKLFMGERACDWIDTERGLAMFGGLDGYKSFMNWRGPEVVANKLEEIALPRDHVRYRPIL